MFKEQIWKQLQYFKLFYYIYEGYLDDERNTDNAWLETIVCNFHDKQNIVYKYLMLVSIFQVLTFMFIITNFFE